MSYITVLLLLLAVAAVHAHKSSLAHGGHSLDSRPTDDPTFIWEKCAAVPVLGNCCLSLYAFPTNLTVLAEVTVGDFTLFKQELTATAICADDVTLLQLIDKIPALLPFKPLIMALIALHKFIPADVFHICLMTKNLTITRTDVSGCSSLDVLLMCFDSDCLYRGNVSLGCFDIPIPHQPEVQRLPSSHEGAPLSKHYSPERQHKKPVEHPGLGALRGGMDMRNDEHMPRPAKRMHRK